MKKRVAVVGATGIAGQQFLLALQNHPWFEVSLLAASERSAGKSYGEAIRDAKTGARRWWCQEEPPPQALSLPVYQASSLNMGWCINCHIGQSNPPFRARYDCSSCHY